MKLGAKIALGAAGVLAAACLTYVGLHYYKPQATAYTGEQNPYITPKGEALVSAHRSGGGIYPENTMLAFKSCAESEEFQTDIFEFDLHMTKDGRLIVLHDDTLDRTTNAEEHFGASNILAIDKTYDELRALNCGEHFTDDAGNTPYAGLRGDDIPDDLRVVALEDVLDYLESVKAYKYIIDIKNGGEDGYRGVDELYRILKERDMLSQVVFGTFNGEVSVYVDENYPDLLRSAGIKEVLSFYFSALVNRKLNQEDIPFVALQIPANQYFVFRLGTQKFLDYAHSYNLAVQYWTINDEDEIRRLNEIGADAIITDIPNRAHEIIHGE